MDGTFNNSEINNSICEAVGCSSKATDKIVVKVGTLGIISLLVCSNCIGKFQSDSAQETNKLGSTTKTTRRKPGVNCDI
jgi:hypothetical protein